MQKKDRIKSNYDIVKYLCICVKWTQKELSQWQRRWDGYLRESEASHPTTVTIKGTY